MKKVLEAIAVGLAWPASAFVVRSIDNGTPTAPQEVELVGAVTLAVVLFAISRWAQHVRGAGWEAIKAGLSRDQAGSDESS